MMCLRTGKTRIVILLFLFCALIIPAIISHAAREIGFRVTADKTVVSLGTRFQMNIIFDEMRDIPPPDIPSTEEFKIRYLGPSSRVSIVNGQMASSITHIYTLIPLKEGTFKLGPYSFNYRGDTYSSNAFTVQVITGAVPQQSAQRTDRYRKSGEYGDRAFLVMKAGKTRAYINELIPLSVKLYADRLSIRDIQYPEFEQQSFSVQAFGDPTQYREYSGGVPYGVMEFKTYIFGTRAGKFFIGPAILKGNVMTQKRSRSPFSRGAYDDEDLFESFFGAYDIFPLELESNEVPMVVLALPKKGRPESFNGAVGKFRFNLSASPREVKVGDPITLKMFVTGEGNFNTVLAPKLDLGEHFKTYKAEVSKQEKTKVFEQVLLPTSHSITEIPPVKFSFFDPVAKKYKTVTTKPIKVKVEKSDSPGHLRIVEDGKAAYMGSVPQEEVLGRDIVYIKESPGAFRKKGPYLYKNKLFLGANIFVFFIFLGLLFIEKRQERLRKDVRYARRLVAPKNARMNIKRVRIHMERGQLEKFYDVIFKTLQGYFGDKFHLPSSGITGTIVDEVLAPKGVKENILKKTRALFEDCDMARYAPSSLDAKKMGESFRSALEIIDYFERKRL